MNINVFLMVASLFYLILIAVLYFSKEKVQNFETKLYKYILISSIIGVILDLIGVYVSINVDDTHIIRWIVLKLYYAYLLTITYLLTVYMFIPGNYIKLNKKQSREMKIYTFIYIICILIHLVLPISYFKDGNIIYAYGPDNTFLYAVVGITIFWWLIFLLKDIKKFKQKKNLPIVCFVILMAPVIYIQMKNPEYLLVSGLISFIVVMMYHTIENPDVKIINELNKNRKLIEKANEDKSNFLFRMAQEVRQPVDNIIEANGVMKKIEHNEEMDKGLRYVDYESKNLKSIVNDVLGVSRIDSYNIKLYKTNYRPAKFFEEIFTKYKATVNEKIEFRSNISKNIPEILYGDAVKLKQVISTILENAVEYTKEGFIECNVDAIIKNDVCRLVITIEDSGIGMSIDKVNEILSYDQELTEEEIQSLDQVNLNLNIASKIIKLLGGNIIVKSEEKVGTEFIIVIEQKIKETKQPKVAEYEEITSKRVLLVDNNKEFIEEISKELKKYNIEIVTTMYGSDCVEKIKNNQKYDLIILDDEMEPDSGLATLKELKKIPKFKTPVIVTLEKGKEPIKEHYIEEGFKDYLLKEKIETETKRIKEEYL